MKRFEDFLAESMKSWRVELISGEENLGEVKIRRGIFQGDSLSPMLVLCLLPLTLLCLIAIVKLSRFLKMGGGGVFRSSSYNN